MFYPVYRADTRHIPPKLQRKKATKLIAEPKTKSRAVSQQLLYIRSRADLQLLLTKCRLQLCRNVQRRLRLSGLRGKLGQTSCRGGPCTAGTGTSNIFMAFSSQTFMRCLGRTLIRGERHRQQGSTAAARNGMLNL